MRTGVDITDIKRFKKLLKDENFLNRIFTEKEQQHIFAHKTEKGQLERLAGKYAGKEAVSKLLGTGIGNGVVFKDIEILPNFDARPIVNLFGKAKLQFEKLKLSQLDISISHDAGIAIAYCVAI